MVRIRPVTENDRGNRDVTVHRQEVGKETVVVQLDNNQTISYICNHLFDATDSQEQVYIDSFLNCQLSLEV